MKERIKQHIILWGIWITFVLITDVLQYEQRFNSLDFLINVVIEIYVFYSAFFILTKFDSQIFKVKIIRIFFFSIKILLSLLIFFLIDFYYRTILAKKYSLPQDFVFTIKKFSVDGILWYIQFFLFALCLFFVEKSIKKQKALRIIEKENFDIANEKLSLAQHNAELQKEKLQLEKEVLQTENLFLRSQINPHFLHNTLNFFYSKSFEGLPEVAEGILTLSQIMRYLLGATENSEGLVLLSEEIEHINNIIKLQQLRFSNRLNIEFNIEGNVAYKSIIPVVLITMVENAFKHGDFFDVSHPVKFYCKLDDCANKFYFEVSNKKKKGLKEISTGIGLDNTFRRLQGSPLPIPYCKVG